MNPFSLVNDHARTAGNQYESYDMSLDLSIIRMRSN